MQHLATCGLLLLANSCTIAPSALPQDDHLVVVKGVRIPVRHWLPWYTRFADHMWVDVRHDDGWRRVEWNRRTPDVTISAIDDKTARLDHRWERPVRVTAWFTGDKAASMGVAVLEQAPKFPYQRGYNAWPGPNSNTFVEWLAHQVPGMWIELPTTAIGRDYAAWLHAGVTTTRLGLELETRFLGLQVGLREGVELHLLGLTTGIGIWPPSIKLPFLPAIPFDWSRR